MESFIRKIIQHRILVVALTLLVTVGFLSQLRSLQVVVDSDAILPQSHPYIATGNLIERVFGNKFTVVIGLTPKKGGIYQSDFLGKVKRITARLQASPATFKNNISSLAARKSKDIRGGEEGMIVTPLMEKVPTSSAELEKLRQGVAANPVFGGLLASKDGKTTQIVVEFKKIPGGFSAIQGIVEKAIAPERDNTVEINISGMTVFLALLEKYSARMTFFFPVALLIIGLIHYEAFRTAQALILPLVTALLAVVWGMGFLGLMKEPFDVFNATTPILILAIAAGHAVQILKRYYEEFAHAKEEDPAAPPKQLSERAVLRSLTKVGPVMMVACTVAALGFFSLIIFEIKSIRTFGIFTGAGVLSALILELTFIPALRVMLPAPGEREILREREETFWDRLTSWFLELALHRRKTVYVAVLLLVAALSLGGYWIRIDNSQKGYFYGSIQARQDDDRLNDRMAGTNTFYVLVEGDAEDTIKRPDVLRFMDGLQHFIDGQGGVGKTLSIVDFIKKMNQAMNADKGEFYSIPDTRELVAQYLLLYSNSGEPGDFDAYVDYNYQNAVVTGFLKSDSSAYLADLVQKVSAYGDANRPSGVRIRLGGGTLSALALNEIMIREKILNIVQIMGAVFLISSLVFRSLLAGVLILVPLVAAVLVNFGIMGILGIPLQIATSLVSAMAVGIGADYGIYMSYRMREELRANPDETAAIKKAFQSAGKAALFVSSAVAGGFGVLVFSPGFLVHMWMGFLIGLAMLVSSTTALTLFPALLFTLRPKFIFGERNQPVKVPRLATALLLVFSLASVLPKGARAQAPTPLEIAQKSFATTKVLDSKTDSTFRLINSSGQERVRETNGFTKLISGTTDNMRLVHFLSPSDVKGTKTLLIEHTGKDDDIWIYLPAMKKVRRLVASNKRDSFVGTDFSYGDVIGHRPENWLHKLLREEGQDGKPCYVLESLPKTAEISEVSGYSKRVAWIDKDSFVMLKGEAYDTAGQLLKKYSARDVRKVDAKNNKWQPMILEAENVQTGHKTILEMKNFKANVGVSDDVFTARFLEKQ